MSVCDCFNIIFSLILFAAIFIASCYSGDADVNITCEVEECRKCYKLLVENLLKSDGNHYNITRIFFPPSKAPPVSVIVYYDFKDENGVINPSKQQLWFWTTSTYYHFQPLTVLQYQSLFFTDPEFRQHDRLYLTLDDECANTTDDYMQLLTQRVRIQ